jgi:hypothetical protein
MSSWTHIHLEAYCTFSWATQKEFHPVGLDGKKYRVMKNKNYIPANKRPSWCKKRNKKKFPQYKCLESHCPFFCYCNANEKDYRIFDKAYTKNIKRFN